LVPEYKLGPNSDMRYGNPDYMSIPYEISKEDYDTFGVSWLFSEKGPNIKVPI